MTIFFFEPLLAASTPERLHFRELLDVVLENGEIVAKTAGGDDFRLASIDSKPFVKLNIDPVTFRAFYPNRTMSDRGWTYCAFRIIP